MPATGMRGPAGSGHRARRPRGRGEVPAVRKDELRLAAIGGVSLPTSFGSDGSQFIGDDLPTLRGGSRVQYRPGKLSFGANAGVILRKPRTIYDSTIGPQLTWGVAGAVAPHRSVLADRRGLRARRPRRASRSTRARSRPKAACASIATGSVAVVLGGGAGLVKGIGSPESRFFVSVGYAPDVRDTDGDGIPNGRDKCPLIPEDKDGFQDEDGCPDDDNDGDRRPDARTSARTRPRTSTASRTTTAAPSSTTTRTASRISRTSARTTPRTASSLPERRLPRRTSATPTATASPTRRRVPDEEEDIDGFEDGDGCPEADNDKRRHPRRARQVPAVPRGQGRLRGRRRLPRARQRQRRRPRRAGQVPGRARDHQRLRGRRRLPRHAAAVLVKLDGDRLVVDRCPRSTRRA